MIKTRGKAVVGLLAMLLLASMPLVGACAKEAPAPAPAPAPSPPAKPIELTLGHWVPVKSKSHRQVDAFRREVEERTKGRVRITIYPAGALGSPKTHHELLLARSMDISQFLPVYFPGKYPLWEMFQLPFIGPDNKTHILAMQELVKGGLVDKVFYEEAHLICADFSPQNHILTKGMKVRVPTDLKGVKMRAVGGVMTTTLEKAGAATVSVAYPEIYSALERGVVEAAMTDYTVVDEMGLDDFIRYVCELHACATAAAFIMNNESYESLPKDIQKILDEAGDHSIEALLDAMELGLNRGKDALIAKGAEIYVPTPAERQLWIDTFRPVWDEWLKTVEGKGLPGRELLHEYGVTVKKLGAEWPYEY